MTFADLSPLANHLWQSTLFAAVAWLLTLALRKNRAAVRYWIWLAASVKFLIPFSLLVRAGAQLGWRTAPALAHSRFSFAIDEIGQPFAVTASAPLPAVAAPALNPLPAILFGIWLCGIAIGVVFWMRWWRQMRAIRHAATPLDLHLPIRVMSSSARLEPGVAGIFKPVLLLPAGVAERLTPPQLEAILAHELRHVERRDNLTAATHMLVETIFWFHPLVWWIRTRLIEERERACDEEALQGVGEPRVYAEVILEVCKLYLEFPVVCVSGISGGNLKKRIERIMTGARVHRLSFARKLLLAGIGTMAAGGPILIGAWNSPVGRAQSQAPVALAPSFEVASVKPGNPNGPRDFRMYPGGRLSFTNVDLGQIILEAFSVKRYQLSGGPRWLFTDAFDIDAKAEGDPTREQMMAMLRTLLADRFQLKVRLETREGDVYTLVVAKGGPKLKESTAQDSYIRTYRNTPPELPGVSYTNVGQKASIAMLADRLTGIESCPVLDRTGLKGEYDFRIDYAIDNDPETGPSIFSALQEQLGLKLEAAKGLVETLVIDKAEKPSAN